MRSVLIGIFASLLTIGGLSATAAPSDMQRLPSVIETTPTEAAGDTADDPAIWVNRIRPADSLIIANEKALGRLTVYNLAGEVVQTITGSSGFFGNVDVRGDLVVAAHAGVWIWRVVPTDEGPRLSLAREPEGNVVTAGEGLCLWDPGAPGLDDGLFAINIHRTEFRVRMHPLTDSDSDGLLLVEPPVRDFRLGSEGEGCDVNDVTDRLFIAEEDVGIWRFNLNSPGSGMPQRTMFAPISATLSADIEGVAVADGILYASAQNVRAPRYNWVAMYSIADRSYVGSFRVVDGATSDDCDQTDGLDAYGGYIGPNFPDGLFVCQDGFNDAPGYAGNQNFKLIPLPGPVGQP
jgi:myo-inositol-hexaphosphate 3-phosphohydrolase